MFDLFREKPKTASVVVTFPTTYDALNLSEHCKKAAITGRLIPIPRQLSANCGMAWQSPIADKQQIEALIASAELEIEGVFELAL